MMETDNLYRFEGSDDASDTNGAPILEVPHRKIVAIEHPCVILNLDKGLATFGQEPDFQKLLVDRAEPSSVPLWFRPDNPTSKPIVSHHTATNNVLLKITVPKRTGRKRKRGSNDPFTGEINVTNGTATTPEADQVSSVGRYDAPGSILRKMQDSVDDYSVEAVGNVRVTHRYRGLADFQFANTESSFLTKTAEHLLPMKVSKLREIKFTPGVATGPNQEIIPPPHFTDKLLGFNYNYEQNPNTKVEGDEVGKPQLINVQGRKLHSFGYFINHGEYPVPQKARQEPELKIPDGLMNQLEKLMEERPIWTRRAILNRITGDYSDSLMRIALQLIGYQFRGGPWRDAFVKYGVDPRSDPKFRAYQTLAFKLERNIVGTKKMTWEAIRKGQFKSRARGKDRDSHIWNGDNYSTDGKFWQVCDIVDPFVRDIIEKAPLRPECDLKDSGWFYKGTWAKVKMIMKVKMIAIKKGRMGSDKDNPQRPGFLYNSFLEERIQQWPDKSDKSFGLTLEPFLRPIEEEDKRYYRRRGGRKKKQRLDEPITAEKPSSQGGEGGDEPGSWDSDGMIDENGEAPGNEEDIPSLPDRSWDDDVLEGDIDIDDGDEDIDEYEEEYYENDEGEEEEYGGEDDDGVVGDNFIEGTYD